MFLDLHFLSCLGLVPIRKLILNLNYIAESTSSITAVQMVIWYHWLQRNQVILQHVDDVESRTLQKKSNDVESYTYCNLKLIFSPYVSSPNQETESFETAVTI